MTQAQCQARNAIYAHAVSCEAALARSVDAEHAGERDEYRGRAESHAADALTWARVPAMRGDS